jgi:tetratricopeptide (TPR) repeat protein
MRIFVFLLALNACISTAVDVEDEIVVKVENVVRVSFQAEAEGRFDDALLSLERHNTTISSHPIILYRKAKLLMRRGSLENSLTQFAAAAVQDPQMPGLFSHAAFVMIRLNDTTSARRLLRAAHAMDPHDLWIGPLMILISRMELKDPLKRTELAPVFKRSRPKSSSQDPNTVIVTAANSLYFGCAGNMIGSAQRTAPSIPIVLYDIGLTDMERAVAATWQGVTLRRLDFAALPPHVSNIRNKAWKPLVRLTAYYTAGAYIHCNYWGIYTVINYKGIYTVIK